MRFHSLVGHLIRQRFSTNLVLPNSAPEVNIMEFCFEKLNVPIIGRVKAPGTLEGGDFFPAGKDLCLVGVCAQQLLVLFISSFNTLPM